jgi:hypothetical protein
MNNTAADPDPPRQFVVVLTAMPGSSTPPELRLRGLLKSARRLWRLRATKVVEVDENAGRRP